MTQNLARTEIMAATELRLSRRALKALAEVPDLRCGGLSPLARLASPGAPSDRASLVAAIEATSGPWRWAVPALLDPRLTCMVVLGDGQTGLLGQYLWPDPEGRGPGFRVSVGSEDLGLAGPLHLDQTLLDLYDLLALGSVAEPEPVRLLLTTAQFWAVAALLDAYQAAVLRQRLARVGGRPTGLLVADIAAAWVAGQTTLNPGWAVSLFTLLLPDQAPDAFEARLAAALAGLETAELLTRLEGESGDPLDDMYVLGDELDLFCSALVGVSSTFGLVVQRQREPGRVEVTVLGGWRTGGGIWLAEVSEIDQDRVELLLTGPTLVSELLDNLLDGRAATEAPEQDGEWRAFGLATLYSKDSLLTQLAAAPLSATTPTPAAPDPAISPRPGPASGGPAPRFCGHCGAPMGPGARFCASCGSPLRNA